MGRKPPLGNHGWISSPERRETATKGRSRVPTSGGCVRDGMQGEGFTASVGTGGHAVVNGGPL
jgi:hypothetical protein